MYAVRFRVPAALRDRLGREFARSLGVADPATAKGLAALAGIWFRELCGAYLLNETLTKTDLADAAERFLAEQLRLAKSKRSFHPEHREADIASQLELTTQRADELYANLQEFRFDSGTARWAGLIAQRAGVHLDEMSDDNRRHVLETAVRAEMELLRFVDLSLTDPTHPFEARPLSAIATVAMAEAAPSTTQPRALRVALTLQEAVDRFIQRKQGDGVGQSHIAEMRRALGWMLETWGEERAVAGINSDDLRDLRDAFEHMDRRAQGLKRPLAERQTNNPDHHIAPQTAAKYWQAVQSLFGFLENDRYVGGNPATGIKTRRSGNRPTRTPEAFSDAEVQAILKTPLYAGRMNNRSFQEPGSYIERGSYWWAGLIGLYTGMRAGEIAQLEVEDFDFGSDIPVVKVQKKGSAGPNAKRVKNKSSIRDVPLSVVLLNLGLQQFVERRSKAVGTARVFPDVSLGQGDRKSDGMTHFWRRLLIKHNLHKPGRATHVFRHTVSAKLRDQGVAEETITDIVGHAGRTVTRGYGGNKRPLSERAGAIAKLDYGVHVVTLIECLEATARARGGAR
jgi:integrase